MLAVIFTLGCSAKFTILSDYESNFAPCYEQFKSYLQRSGFKVFPEELTCPSSNHPFVDIAARMGSYLWAFEYKSTRDDIRRAIDQARAYSEWFDYVVVVSEKRVDHRNSDTYWKLKQLGSGLWNYVPETGQCFVQSNPVLLAPEASRRRSVSLRFSFLERGDERRRKLGIQSSLCNWVK